MRCAPSYRHNDITGLIIGKPNSTNELIGEDLGVIIRLDASQ